MSEHTSLVVNALEYYDLNNEKYSHIYKNAKYYKIVLSNNDMKKNDIILYDEHKNIILKSAYEIIGVYSKDTNIWAWAWAIPFFYKNSTYISKKIINYGIDLDPEEMTLKTELITSRFRISNMIQIDIHVALTSYLSKNPVTFNFLISEEEWHKKYEYSYNDTTTEDSASNYVEINSSATNGVMYYLFLLDYEKYI